MYFADLHGIGIYNFTAKSFGQFHRQFCLANASWSDDKEHLLTALHTKDYSLQNQTKRPGHAHIHSFELNTFLRFFDAIELRGWEEILMAVLMASSLALWSIHAVTDQATPCDNFVQWSWEPAPMDSLKDQHYLFGEALGRAFASKIQSRINSNTWLTNTLIPEFASGNKSAPGTAIYEEFCAFFVFIWGPVFTLM